MHAFALLLVASVCQEDGKEFYKFNKGTKWVYRNRDGKDASKTTEMVVTGEEDGKVVCESKDFKEGSKEASKVDTVALYVSEGILRFAEKKNGKWVDMFAVLKIGGKPGDKWKSPFADSGLEGDVEHKGTCEVVLFKGEKAEKSYKDAVWTQLKLSVENEGKQFSFTCDFYFVKGIGMVKIAMKNNQGQDMDFELQEFTPAK